MKKQIITLAVTGLLLSSCGIYTKYEPVTSIPDQLYGGEVVSEDTASLGNMDWRELFTDPYLQSLIEVGLQTNTDYQSAQLRVEQAQAALMSAKLAFLPAFALSPQGTVSSFDKAKASQTYTLPVVSSWEIDLFGRLLNAKRGAKVTLLQSEAYKQAVQTQVISAIANAYYTLLMLDKQLAITEETALLWQKSVETMKAMKEAGMVNEAAIAQSEANSYMIAASIPDLKQSIRETENSLSLLLKQAPQRIERGKLEDQNLPTLLNAGVPVQLLSNRPDVKAAEMALASTFYNTNQARASFYPQLTINGTLGWTNNSGMGIVNPGKMIATAVGALAQPIFNKGALTARLRIAKAQQEEAMLSFEQSLLNAGSEVSNALTQYQTAQDKIIQREKQIFSLEKSVDYTQELLTLGTSTYLEVLTAQQSLLSAQLSGISDEFQRMQAVVNLYHALGGGRTE